MSKPSNPKCFRITKPSGPDHIGPMMSVHFVIGRGRGETLAEKPQDIFWAAWEETVPSSLYTVRRAEMDITTDNGSHLLMRSPHVDNDSFRF